jgi:hypothetical protein
MKNKILKLQTDITYNVVYDGAEYTVVQIEDLENGYLQWDIFDDDGNDLDETDPDLRDEIISFTIQHT